LSSLSEAFKAVEIQTSAFQAQCQNLLSDQKRLTKLADDMKESRQYYEYLEPITRRLNAPGAGNLVRAKEFPEMLKNLDACLDYMQGHPKQLEAAAYQSRYRLLLTRALTLIRVHFTNSLRSLAADVSQRIADKQLNDTTQSALLYAKFRVGAPELRDLGIEIQKRAILPADAEEGAEPEYQSLMNELYQSYSATRGRLVLPIVTKKMAEIASVDDSVRDVVAFARSAIGFVRGICLDEYELWGDWFIGEGGVYEFLEALCEPLFDYLRPRTIHETKLEKLCELCTFVQTRYMETDEDEDELEDRFESRFASRKLNFATLIQPALADAQTRLVFLVQASLRDEIEYYKPKPEDLAYPRKSRRRSSASVNGKQPALSGRKGSIKEPPSTPGPKTPTIVDHDEDGLFDAQWGLNSKSTGDWYPTLPRAVRLLSRIYRLVNSTVFDDLAHRIVHSTTHSLVQAAAQIRTKTSTADGNLFLISNLLRLKQQIVAFDIEYVTPEVSFDFSSVTNTFYELRERGGLWNPGTWYKLASGGLLPRVVENMLDAKAELDGQLRAVINDFVSAFAGAITAPLAETKATVGKKGKAEPLDPKRATTAVRGLAEKEVPLLRAKLAEYVEDVRTRETLVAAVRDQVVLAYEEWVDGLVGVDKIAKVSRKGKGREDEVWGAQVFGEWCERVFGSGRGSIGEEDDEDEM